MHHQYSAGLHWFASAVALATFLLIITGGLVTSNDAGLAVPDWPLSYGQLMPEMVGGVFYEHGHRLIAATVGLFTVVLSLWLAFREPRRWVRRMGWVALIAVVVQGLLGGVTVLWFLPVAVSVLHACLAQAFFCVVITLAWVTSRGWSGDLFPLGEHRDKPGVRLGLLMVGVIYVQLALGAVLRHSGMVGGSKGGELVTSALLLHVLGALLVTGVLFHSILVLNRSVKVRLGFRLASLLLVLLAIQLTLGIGAYLVRLSVPTRIQPLMGHTLVTTGHVAVGALMLGCAVIMTLSLTQTRELPDRMTSGPQLAGGRS